jgi:2'-phosphotransferase
MRSISEVVIYLDLAAVLADGIEVYESTNGVILSSGVDGTIAPKYFRKVDRFRQK